jgi:predicted phage terminase large subunit-like protein
VNETKKHSIQVLAGAIQEANVKSNESIKSDFNTIKTLLEECLTVDHDPRRAGLLEQMRAGAKLTGPDGLRKKLAAFDLNYFGRAYLPHYFSRPSPPFHRELDALFADGVLKGLNPLDGKKLINLQPGCKRATAAPRGHAKSTNFTFKDGLHAVVYEYKHFIILMSDTYGQAAGFLSAYAEELEENEAVREDFGELRGGVWREDVIVTKTNIKVQALGAGQKVRGLKHKNWRPDLFILDDMENDENVRTPEQRKKLHNWFTKAVLKAGDSYTDFVYIGTMLHYDGLLAKILKNPGFKGKKYKAVLAFSNSKLWDEWEKIYTDLSNENHEADALAFFEANREDMLTGTQVLWEEKNSYYDLMRERVDGGVAAFNSELQNEPINPDDCLFNPEWFDFYNPYEVDFRDPRWDFFGFVDPSLGKSKKSDFSAIITLAMDKKTGYMLVADADIERRHPDRIIEDVLQKARWLQRDFKKKYRKFGAETNQFQWFLKEQLAKAAAAARIYLPIVEVNQTSDKTLRIQTLQPDIKNKYIKFNREHKRLLEQLTYFPLGDHDDGPDALEGARALAVRRISAGFVHVEM